MSAISRLVDEILTPSGFESGYGWSVIATGHVMLGAALAPVWPIALLLYAAKEAYDLRRGGRLWDGAADLLLVLVGMTYSGPWAWPVIVFAAICVGAVIKEAR